MTAQTLTQEPTATNKKNFVIAVWHVITQFQPTNRLVKVLLLWWVLVCSVAIFRLTDYISVNTDELLLICCQWLLVAIVTVVLVDLLILIAISQPRSYSFQRQHSKNLAIFHIVHINVQLDFAPSRLHFLYVKLIQLCGIKRINLEVQDDYPDELQPLEHDNHALMQFYLPLDTSTPVYDDYGLEVEHVYRHHIKYPVKPIKRGVGRFGELFIRVYSPLSLIRKKLALTLVNHQQNNVRILADFTNLLTNQLSAVSNNPYDIGIQPLKKEGESTEFLNMREYKVGDSMRQIDWKITSRYRKLMSRAYEEDTDQDVVFLLDCGEQMRYQQNKAEATLSYFDKVLNAVLLLSYIANKQGDSVGLVSFGGVDKVLLPQKGKNLMRYLLNETAQISPTDQTSDYVQAIDRLNRLLTKRSLIIIITNTRQEAGDEVIHAMKHLSHKHQLVFANLTEQEVQDRIDTKAIPTDTDEALLYHTLYNYQQTRHQLHKKIRQHTNAFCITSTANQLAPLLTSAYASIRQR